MIPLKVKCEFCEEDRIGFSYQVGNKTFEVCEICARQIGRWMKFLTGWAP